MGRKLFRRLIIHHPASKVLENLPHVLPSGRICVELRPDSRFISMVLSTSALRNIIATSTNQRHYFHSRFATRRNGTTALNLHKNTNNPVRDTLRLPWCNYLSLSSRNSRVPSAKSVQACEHDDASDPAVALPRNAESLHR